MTDLRTLVFQYQQAHRNGSLADLNAAEAALLAVPQESQDEWVDLGDDSVARVNAADERALEPAPAPLSAEADDRLQLIGGQSLDRLKAMGGLNAQQQNAVCEWAADDRLWTTQETVEINLATFARSILAAHGQTPEPSGWQDIAAAQATGPEPQAQTPREKLTEAERLVHEVIEAWNEKGEWDGTPMDVGMLVAAQMILSQGVGTSLSEEEEKALDEARTSARLLKAIHRSQVPTSPPQRQEPSGDNK